MSRLRFVMSVVSVCASSLLLRAEVVKFTGSTHVVHSDVISGEDSVEIDKSSGDQAWFVSLEGENTYSGGTTIKDGGVVVVNASSLGTGRIACHNDTKIRVCVNYRALGTTLKAALLDRIDVVDPGNGTEPHVTIQLCGEGLKNDVDFTDQPYLWLAWINKYSGFTTHAGYDETNRTLQGVFTPYGNEYRLGYSSEYNNTYGISITNLCDAADGTPRRVFMRGCNRLVLKELNNSGNPAWSGGTYVEGGESCEIAVDSTADFPKLSDDASKTNCLVFRGGRLRTTGPVRTFTGNNARIVIEPRTSATSFHCYGGSNSSVTFNIPIEGDGKIKFTDSSREYFFTSPSNTFTGEIQTDQTVGSICFGNGANFSWRGSAVRQTKEDARLTVIVDSNEDAEFCTSLSATGGSFIKRGRGNISLTGAIDRAPTNGPSVIIEGGSLTLAQTAPFSAEGTLLFRKFGVLDLNFNENIGSVWLPQGNGKIVNVPGGGVTFAGSALEDEAFSGTIDGTATISKGTLIFDGSLGTQSTTGVSRVNVAAEGGISFKKPMAGMTLEFWYDTRAGYNSTPAHAFNRALEDAFFARLCDLRTNLSEVVDGTFEITHARFAEIMGENKDQFVARATGYFWAEEEGEYQFKLTSDDFSTLTFYGTNVVCSVLPSQTGNATGSIHLTAGYHPISVYFKENTGDEYIKVHLRRPGDANLNSLLPTRLLSSCAVAETQTLELGGAGEISLGDDAQWPQGLDLDSFTGTVRLDDHALSADAGSLAIGSGTLLWDATGENQIYSGQLTLTGGDVTVDPGDSASAAITNILVTGTASLNVVEGKTLTLAPSTWTFDLTGEAGSRLTLTGGCMFGDGPVLINLVDGFAPIQKNLIADFTGLSTTPPPSFERSPELPAKVMVFTRDGKLYAMTNEGTILIFR